MLNKILGVVIILLCFLVWFYRLPPYYTYPDDIKNVKSPAWGKVLDIKKEKDHYFVAIFLSPFDIHYQYAPINGVVEDITPDYTGKFHLAHKLNKSDDNEKVIHTIRNQFGQFKVTQIAGFLPRCIEWYHKDGDSVIKGDLIGMILFGSRVDIEIPFSYKLNIKKGDKVKGGITNLATLI